MERETYTSRSESFDVCHTFRDKWTEENVRARLHLGKAVSFQILFFLCVQ